MLQGNKEGIKKLPNNLERSVTIGMETEIFTKVFKFDQKIWLKIIINKKKSMAIRKKKYLI